jgi:hypothetical protein
LPEGRIADKNYIWLSEWQLENINCNYLLPIDFDAYRKLRNHIAKALVPLLQVWLYATRERGHFEKRYDDLCQILNVRQYPHVSRMVEKLEPSLGELVVHGYLSDWRIDQTSDRTGYKLVFYHGPKFIRHTQNQTKILPPAGDHGSNAAISPSQEDDQLLGELMQRGIGEATAQELLNNLAVGQNVMDQLEWGDFQINQAPPGNSTTLLDSTFD